MAVNRNVSLAARADQGSSQLNLLWVVNIVKRNAVVVPDKKMVAAEGQI
jgi:hypothetical protein